MTSDDNRPRGLGFGAGVLAGLLFSAAALLTLSLTTPIPPRPGEPPVPPAAQHTAETTGDDAPDTAVRPGLPATDAAESPAVPDDRAMPPIADERPGTAEPTPPSAPAPPVPAPVETADPAPPAPSPTVETSDAPADGGAADGSEQTAPAPEAAEIQPVDPAPEPAATETAAPAPEADEPASDDAGPTEAAAETEPQTDIAVPETAAAPATDTTLDEPTDTAAAPADEATLDEPPETATADAAPAPAVEVPAPPADPAWRANAAPAVITGEAPLMSVIVVNARSNALPALTTLAPLGGVSVAIAPGEADPAGMIATLRSLGHEALTTLEDGTAALAGTVGFALTVAQDEEGAAAALERADSIGGLIVDVAGGGASRLVPAGREAGQPVGAAALRIEAGRQASDAFQVLRNASALAERDGSLIVALEASPTTLTALGRWLALPGDVEPAPVTALIEQSGPTRY